MIGHPVLFLRDKHQPNPKLTQTLLEKVLKRPKKLQVYEKTFQFNPKPENLSKNSQIKDLTKLLLDIIVKRRLYKDSDLHDFFETVEKLSLTKTGSTKL